jgi:methionyl-tRNA synthetase
MTKQIIVDVMDDGEVKIETKGYSGPICLQESKFLKDVLGEETSRVLTATYYKVDQCNNVRRTIRPLCG